MLGAEFEQMLAARLLRTDGGVVTAQGILQRMFAASTSVPAMYDMIRTVRGAGFRTGLLSNSWGCDEYPRADFPGAAQRGTGRTGPGFVAPATGNTMR